MVRIFLGRGGKWLRVVICMYEQAWEHLSINTLHFVSLFVPCCVDSSSFFCYCEMVYIFEGEELARRRGHRSMYVCVYMLWILSLEIPGLCYSDQKKAV